MRIVFMGTPDFAVPSLEILYNAGYDIVGVITAPDRLGGRGRKTVIESPIKKFALNKELNILQPPNLKNKEFVATLKELNADIQIVVAFRMLPEIVWNMPANGTYNLHGSLLPKYRGAAPINWSVIQGDKITGVTSFKLKHAIDTGSVLFQKEIPIYPSDNATAVHDRMMFVAADVVYETVKAVDEKKANLKEQDDSLASHAPKLNKDNTKLDFTLDCKTLHNKVRGLSYYPSAWFELAGKQLKVYESEIELLEHDYKAGTVISDNKSYLKAAGSDGYLILKDVQLTGKKRMGIKDFLNGYDTSQINEVIDC